MERYGVIWWWQCRPTSVIVMVEKIGGDIGNDDGLGIDGCDSVVVEING